MFEFILWGMCFFLWLLFYHDLVEKTFHNSQLNNHVF